MIRKSLLLLCLVCAPSISIAEEPSFDKGYTLPASYPSSFSKKGILQGINLSQRLLVIDSNNYKLDLNTPVHLLNLNTAILQNLRPGMPVGFSIRLQNGVELITEIWELPPKAVPLS